jgi:hypothetical protein
MKLREVAGNCIMKSFITCTLSQEGLSSMKLVNLFNKNQRVPDGLGLSFRWRQEIRADVFLRKPVGNWSFVEVAVGTLKSSKILWKQKVF